MPGAMFQFYDGIEMIDDTPVITIEEAIKKFEDRKGLFADALKAGRDCQMCIWVECEHESDYRVALKDWHSSSVKYENGIFWVRE
jgi:hypothetical protein